MAAKRTQRFWIKERENPQLGTYYVAMGRMSNTAAKRNEKSLYGFNVMHGYDTEAEYQTRLQQLRDAGERVHD